MVDNKFENCIAVIDNETKEIIEFPRTTAGAYRAAKLVIANMNDFERFSFTARVLSHYANGISTYRYEGTSKETIKRLIDLLLIRDIMLKIGIEFHISLINIMATIITRYIRKNSISVVTPSTYDVEIENFSFTSKFINYVYDDFNHTWCLKENTFKLGGKVLPISLKKYVRYCNCGNIYLDQKAMQNDNLPDYKLRNVNCLLGYGDACRDCIDYDYLDICEDCGLIFEQDEMTYIDNEDYNVCNDCLDNYTQCERCGEWFYQDNTDYIYTEDGHYFCSDTCAEGEGYHYSDSVGGWIDYCEDDDEDDNYNSEFSKYCYSYTDKSYTPYGSIKKHALYIGSEIEVDSDDTYISNMESGFFDNLISLMKYKPHLKNDGSLNNGFEICTNPMTQKLFFNKEYWKSAFDHLKGAGWKSHYTNTCGLHFHLSKWFFGYNYNQQFNNIKKVIAFIQNFEDDFFKMSRRKDFSWCKVFDKTPDKKTKINELSYNHNYRYHTINLENFTYTNGKENGDVEFRICKGTLNENTFIASADLFVRLAKNSRKISWKNIDNVKLWLKSLKQDTINYLKDRGCSFGGAL